MKINSIVSLSLLCLQPILHANKIDLMQQDISSWITATDKLPTVVLNKNENTITATRPGGRFNPIVFFSNINNNGTCSSENVDDLIVLNNIGDTVGVRMVFSFNEDACPANISKGIRIGFGNSNLTRITETSMIDIKDNKLMDDIGFNMLIGTKESQTCFWQRPTGLGDYIQTSTRFGNSVSKWPVKPTDDVFMPNKKIEAIFSITKVNVDKIRLYGCIENFEHTCEVANVSNFTFDTLYLHSPLDNPKSLPTANSKMTIYELDLVVP
jgi:hypothetical protein